MTQGPPCHGRKLVQQPDDGDLHIPEPLDSLALRGTQLHDLLAERVICPQRRSLCLVEVNGRFDRMLGLAQRGLRILQHCVPAFFSYIIDCNKQPTCCLFAIEQRVNTFLERRQQYVERRIHVSFAITLKLEREKQGLTQKEVAKRMGINWSAYQRIENPRKTNPTLSTIDTLQKVFGRPFFAL